MDQQLLTNKAIKLTGIELTRYPRSLLVMKIPPTKLELSTVKKI
jgi:hypothetical protein